MRNRSLQAAKKAIPTIQKVFEQFQKQNALENLSQGTLEFYSAKARRFFAFLEDAEQPVDSITEETVEDYIFWMKDKGLSDTTINTNLRMVRAFLNWCMDKGYLERFPIKLVRADEPIKEPYTEEELEKLLKAPNRKSCSFAEYRNWVIVNFLLGTGCRASTLVNLKIEDINFSDGTVLFRHMKTRNQQVVPLTRALTKLLEEYLMYRDGAPSDPLKCNGCLQRAGFFQNSFLNHTVKLLHPCFQHIFRFVPAFQQKNRVDLVYGLSSGNRNILRQKITAQVFSQRNSQPEYAGIQCTGIRAFYDLDAAVRLFFGGGQKFCALFHQCGIGGMRTPFDAAIRPERHGLALQRQWFAIWCCR